jgi:hypothetical protein
LSFVVMPVVAVAVVVALSIIVGGAAAEDLPLELSAPISAFAALSGGLLAARAGRPPSHHGWWALGAGACSVVVFGALVMAFG